MKIVLLAVMAFFAAEATADAQFLKGLFGKSSEKTETVTPATSSGRAAGAALKALSAQYKVDGKLDMSNLTNLMNLATLASNTKDLKGQTDKSDFYKDFAAGLVLGSGNLVNQSNSTSVMGGLSSLVNNVDLSGLTQMAQSGAAQAAGAVAGAAGKANTAVENATEIASSVSNILNLFK